MISPAAAAERAAASRPMRRARGLWAGVSLLIVVLVAGLPSAFGQRVALRRPDSNASGRAKPMPLVNIDDTLGGYLNTARDCIEANEPLRAIEILQRLINLTETTLIADGDGRRYVSMAYKAADLIGSLGEEGLALYRSMYDPQAQRLFEISGVRCRIGFIGKRSWRRHIPRILQAAQRRHHPGPDQGLGRNCWL